MEQVSPVGSPERRQNPRKTVTRPAVINRARFGPQAGWITDVSLEGAFVRSDWQDVPTFTAVEVTVTLSNEESHQVKEYRLPATVARSTGEGIGIRFEQLDVESYSALLDLIYN